MAPQERSLRGASYLQRPKKHGDVVFDRAFRQRKVLCNISVRMPLADQHPDFLLGIGELPRACGYLVIIRDGVRRP